MSCLSTTPVTDSKGLFLKSKKLRLATAAITCTVPLAMTPALASAETTHTTATQLTESQRNEIREIASLARSQGKTEIANHLEDRANGISDRGLIGWARKAAAYALRHYGDKLPSKIRPYAGKIASICEQAEVWEKAILMTTMLQHGIPYDVAEAAAIFIEFTVGF